MLTDRSYILGMWFVKDPDGNDWMFCVWRDDPDAPWFARGRIRMRVDDRIFDSRVE